MKQKLDHWLLGLTRGTLQGGAVAIKTFAATACANAAGVGVPAVNLKQAAVVFAIGAAWHFCDFLATTPLPDDAPAQPTATPRTQH